MDHREELLRAFDNGLEDLEANRRGALTERQAKRLVRSGIRDLFGAVLIGFVLSGILFFIAVKPLNLVQYGLTASLIAAALILGLVTFSRCRAAAVAGRVESLAGPIRVQMRGKAGWYIVVAGRTFKLPIQFWRAQDGASYRVYFAPGVDRVVAMEPEGWH